MNKEQTSWIAAVAIVSAFSLFIYTFPFLGLKVLMIILSIIAVKILINLFLDE